MAYVEEPEVCGAIIDPRQFRNRCFRISAIFFPPFVSVPINARINVVGSRIRERMNKTVRVGTRKDT